MAYADPAEGRARDRERFHRSDKRRRQMREAFLLRKYGLTYAEFDGMWQRQGGRCAICDMLLVRDSKGSTPTRDRCVVDHDHGTGKVRGLLCQRCNLGLGTFDDLPSRLRRATEYLDNAAKSP